MITKDLANRYIKPKEIESLDDIPNGYIKRSLYIIATDNDVPDDIQLDDIVFVTSTNRFKKCIDPSSKKLVTLSQAFYKKEYHTLSQIDINNKFILLDAPPVPDSLTLFVVGGPVQMPNKDFAISEQSITWNGYDLDGQLEVGDTLYIEYLPV